MEAAKQEMDPVVVNEPTETASKGAKKKYRFKPGTVSLREIRKLQKTTTNLIPRKTFYRLVKEISSEFKSDVKMTQEAVNAIQNECGAYITEYFKDSQVAAIHAGRKTILVSDTKVQIRT